MPLTRRAAWLLFLLLAWSACPRRPPSPTSLLEDAAEDAQRSDARARTIALAGFHAWLVKGSAEKAKAHLDAALEKDPAEPWALYGQLLLARRVAHPERAVASALQLVARAPAHPLAAAASRYLLEQAGASVEIDARILDGAQKALAAGARGEIAHLLRSTLAAIHGNRLDASAQAGVLAEMGAADAWTIAGPFSAFQVLDFDVRVPPEIDGSLAGPLDGPYGRIVPRSVRSPDGRLNLDGESPDGNIYVLAADVEIAEATQYIVRSVSFAAHKVFLDGTLLHERRSFARAQSTVGARGVWLDAGRHRLLVKISRENGASLSLALMRADGGPARVRFSPAAGPAPRWKDAAIADVPGIWPRAEDLARALAREAGDGLGAFVAIREGMGRDADGAWRLMEPLAAHLPGSAAVSALRAELALEDRSLPQRISRARATRDLEATLERDPNDVGALLSRARLALDDGRQADASELVKRARAAYAPAGFPVLLLRAHVDLSMGLDALAGEAAAEALAAQPALCEAQWLVYDLARRRNAIAQADDVLKTIEGCPGSRTRRAEHARTRGRMDEAIALYEAAAARDPAHLGTTFSLAQLYVSAGRWQDAEKSLRALREIWPRNADILRRLADVYDHAGQRPRALSVREEALRYAGGDLTLRRQVHRAKLGREPLSEFAIDSKTAIDRYEAQPGTEDAASAMVLDAAAVEAFADGSMVDRIHVIEKALSQEGVSRVAEVDLPSDAQVLVLRTLKKDGRVLEPEEIENKDTISMPGVEVGDYVEYEYLLGHAPRGPAQTGFTAPPFYFRLAGVPNAWSTYVVVAPKGAGLAVDAHNVKTRPPVAQGERQVFKHEESHVPPLIPEPNAPPSSNEYLPWVQAGAGARGNDGVVSLYADVYLSRGRITHEVEAFARSAAGEARDEAAVRAVHAAVMKKLRGRDAGLDVSATTSLAQDRGSRLWAMKASLEALGFPTRLAAVRTSDVDPGTYVFPNESLLPYLALRTTLPDGRKLWLDTSVRLSPFGELPETAVGRPAWLLPEPGRPLETATTPGAAPPQGKVIALELELSPGGDLSGNALERYVGYEAASLAEGFEQLPPDQRKQALQGALARYFGGAEMEGVQLELPSEPGAELVLRYHFRAPRFARAEGARLVLGAITYPAQLGRRFLQLGRRTTPLHIGETDRTEAHVTLKLPARFALNGPLAEEKLASDFGSYVRRERQEGNVVRIDELYELHMGRVAPARYEDFAHFAGQVDLLQTRDLVLERRPGT
jgi:tetratricopeptide (TPR) repeat protein